MAEMKNPPVLTNARIAMQIAGQCWCDEATGHKQMDADLATAFAKRYERMLDEVDALQSRLGADVAVMKLKLVGGEQC